MDSWYCHDYERLEISIIVSFTVFVLFLIIHISLDIVYLVV